MTVFTSRGKSTLAAATLGAPITPNITCVTCPISQLPPNWGGEPEEAKKTPKNKETNKQTKAPNKTTNPPKNPPKQKIPTKKKTPKTKNRVKGFTSNGAFHLESSLQPAPKLQSFKESKVYQLCKLQGKALKHPGWGRGLSGATNFPHRCWAYLLPTQGREEKPGKTPKSYANIFKTLESSTTLRALSQGTPRETETHKLGKSHAQRAPDSSLEHIWKKAREVSRSSLRTQKRACPEHSPAAPPPSPPLLGGAGAPSRLHSTGSEKTQPHTHTHTQTCFFCGGSSTPLEPAPRAKGSLSEAQSRAGGSGRKPAPLRVAQGEGQRLCRQAEPRDSPVGERGRPPPALELSGPGCSAGPARPPGAAAAAASGGGAAERRRFLPTREKSLAQAKLFDHKRRGAAAQLSSLAGECGNEVTGAGACRGSGPGLCRRRGGERCARRRSPAGRVCGDFHQPRAGLAACHPHGALRSSRLP